MLKEPIERGAYYMTDGDGRVHGPMIRDKDDLFWARGIWFNADGTGAHPPLTRRVYIVPTDPAEVVAELRSRADSGDNVGFESAAYNRAADLVAEKLGVK